MIGLFGTVWGLAGFILLLVYTIFRLTPLAVEAFMFEFRWAHWVVLLVNTTFMAYAEGYRGFQKGFSPRVVARAKYLKSHPNLLYALLGPLYVMGYFHINRRRQISTIALTITIIIFIVLIRLLDQPWRGIIDVGVVVGLTWGLISSIIYSIRGFTATEFDHSPEIPAEQ